MMLADQKIKISVIVPIYNVEHFLEKCVDSIISQTYKNLEIILVDDGSTDRSGEICDNYALNDNRVVVIHKENGGAVSARKAGIQIATGEYTIQVDSDDWIEECRLDKIVSEGLITKPDIVSSCGIYMEYPHETQFKSVPSNVYGLYKVNEIWNNPKRFLYSEDVFIKKNIQLSLWSCCYKTELYKKNQMLLDDKVALGQDLIVSLACLMSAQNINIIYNPTYHYRLQREGAISNRKDDYPDYAANLYYESLKKYMLLNNINDYKVQDIIAKFIYNTTMITNYNILYNYYDEYLFPFLNVKNGSRIIVYGAGNLGVEIVNAIDNDKRFNIAAWVDKNKTKSLRSDHLIEKPEVIKKRDFDYIVVAVINSEVSKQIRDDLSKTIDKGKIILMGYDDMDMVCLDNIFRVENGVER